MTVEHPMMLAAPTRSAPPNLPDWTAWVAALSPLVLVVLTGVYVWQTGRLAKAAARQIADADASRRDAAARARRALQLLAGHLFAIVEPLQHITVQDVAGYGYGPLFDSPLPRMTHEVSDLIVLARDVGGPELESAHRAATALGDIAAFATRLQSGASSRLLGKDEEVFAARVKDAAESLTRLMAPAQQ